MNELDEILSAFAAIYQVPQLGQGALVFLGFTEGPLMDQNGLLEQFIFHGFLVRKAGSCSRHINVRDFIQGSIIHRAQYSFTGCNHTTSLRSSNISKGRCSIVDHDPLLALVHCPVAKGLS